jgi:hypothetical protein
MLLEFAGEPLFVHTDHNSSAQPDAVGLDKDCTNQIGLSLGSFHHIARGKAE